MASNAVLPAPEGPVTTTKPFFVGLLGERYGWTPLPDTVPVDYVERLDESVRGLFDDVYIRNPGFEEFVLRPDAAIEAVWSDERSHRQETLLIGFEAVALPMVGMSVTAREIHHGVLDAPGDSGLFFFRGEALSRRLAAQSATPKEFYEPSCKQRCSSSGNQRCRLTVIPFAYSFHPPFATCMLSVII